MGLGPASRGLNDLTTETRVFRQQVSQLPEMSSVLFASAWVTLARQLAAPRRGSLSESSAAQAATRGLADGARGAEAGPGRPRPRGFRVGEGSCGPARGGGATAQWFPWLPARVSVEPRAGPGRDDAKRPLGCASQLDTRIVVTRSVPGAGKNDLGERDRASPRRHFPPTHVLRKPSAGGPQSET